MELIEKQEAMDCCFKPQVRPNEEIFNALKMAIRSEISALPTIDAAPVKHGRWERQELAPPSYLFCSECGFPKKRGTWKFCPNCSAKMDLEGLDAEVH